MIFFFVLFATALLLFCVGILAPAFGDYDAEWSHTVLYVAFVIILVDFMTVISAAITRQDFRGVACVLLIAVSIATLTVALVSIAKKDIRYIVPLAVPAVVVCIVNYMAFSF